MLARDRGALRNCGADLAAHCINDVITTGAEPLFLLDYVAAAELDLEQVAELVEGAAEVCREAGCALIGGETAELPGVYRDGRARLRRHLRRDRRSRRADRRLARRRPATPCRPPLGGRPRERLHARPPRARRARTTTGPTCSRRRGSTSTTSAALRASHDVRALAHVTGGGIFGNLERVLPDGLHARASTGTPGSGRPSSTGSHGTSTRRSCAASSTSGSATAPSSRIPANELVIGRIDVIGVLVSGNGTNLQALIDAGLPVVAVASSRKDAYALDRARAAGVPSAAFSLDCHAEPRGARPGHGDVARGARRRARRPRRLHAAAHAGLPRPLLRPGSSTCTPRCCPTSPARSAIEDALAAGVETTGVTVHYVDEGIDTGPVIAPGARAGRAARDARGADPRGRAPAAARGR